MRLLIPLIVSLLVAPQESPEKKVAQLIERLRADDIAVREAAAKELVAIGEPARALLLKAVEGAADAEFAARAKAVADRIRRPVRGDLPDRHKHRSRRMADAYGDALAEDSVHAALAWLARHQEADGGWSPVAGKKFAADPCAGAGSGDYDDGVTALAVLAFLGAGYDPSFKGELIDPTDRKKWKPADIVRKGLDRLLLRQRKDGGIVGPSKPMYGHAIATLALCEVSAMTGEPVYRDSARRAVKFLLNAMNPGAAWRYTSRSGDNDMSVTGWCVAALDAASIAGVWDLDRDLVASVIDWMDTVTNLGDGRAGYNGAGTGKVFVPGRNEKFAHHETMTAISLNSRRLLDPEAKIPAAAGDPLNLIARDHPDIGVNIDGYYWFWGSLAVHRLDGAGGRRWLKWAEMSRAFIPSIQSVKGCGHGSWDPEVDRWGFEGGRIAVTALNALALLTPAR